jgi:hypothetical protein
LAPVIVGGEQVRLMLTGRYQVEQHDADAERRGFRPRELCADASGNIRTSRGGDVALRRRYRCAGGVGDHTFCQPGLSG